LKTTVCSGASSSAQVFIILFGNPSGALALLVFKLASSFCTPAVVMSNLFILVYSFPGILGRGSSVYTNKASAPDGLPNKIMKTCAEELAPAITVRYIQT
jgi:hypothetical protein